MTPDRAAPELRPCPFCGGEAEADFPCAEGFSIHCPNPNCAVISETEPELSESEAAALWNRRSGEDGLRNVLKVANAILEPCVEERNKARETLKETLAWAESARLRMNEQDADIAKLRGLLAALVNKLDKCKPYIDGAFALQYVHGINIDGPTYGVELEAAREALK
jgi:hypothetical protein